MVFMALVTALAPAAQASTAPFSIPSCVVMMQAAQKHSCCGSSCECTIQAESEDLSAVVPTAFSRFEISLNSLALPSSGEQMKSVHFDLPSEESSPPEEPLYQLYSDYRL